MSLNTVVNKLVRAAAGIPLDISDSDLDRHVAELLANEAKSREDKWEAMGLGALLGGGSSGSGRDSPDPSLPRPNKRFLASVIRTVDGHNNALIRAQEQAAREVRIGRGESSRDGGRSGRSRESGGGAGRLFGGAMSGLGGRGGRGRRGETGERRHGDDRERRRGDDTERSRERDVRGTGGQDSRDGDRREVYSRRGDRDERDRHTERHSRSDRDSRRRRDDSDEESYRHRRQDDRASRDDTRRRDRSLSRSRSPLLKSNGSRSRQSNKTNGHSKPAPSPSPSPPPRSTAPPPPPPEPSSAPPPPPDSPLSSPPSKLSKMDKYFAREYDPRLDYGDIPKEGMIADVGWDNMLAVLKEKGKKRRQQSPGLIDDPLSIPPLALARSSSPEKTSSSSFHRLEKKERKTVRSERKKRHAWSDDSDDEKARAKRKEKRRKDNEVADKSVAGVVNAFSGAGTVVTGMEYVKKGGMREWDVGKE